MTPMQEILQERAALYAAGVMSATQRAEFELLLEFHEELQAHVSGLMEVTNAVLLSRAADRTPPASLRERILAAVSDDRPATVPTAVAKVRTGATGLIEWVNAEFTAMCGYELAELRGRKPGVLLQGAATDARAVASLRSGIRAVQPVEAELINYHKDGSPYRVHVAITPVLDDERKPLFFLAREQKLELAAG